MESERRAENPFRFAECLTVLRMTGRRAADPQALAKHVAEVDEGVLFHHMHQYYLKEPIKAPEYPNDFARWAAESLEDRTLAEKLSGIDPYALGSIADVRRGLLDTLEAYAKAYPPPRPALAGGEFFFNDAVTIVVPTDREAWTLDEFLDQLLTVDSSSVYYHFYEGRWRLGGGEDDFSAWFRTALRRPNLSDRMRRLDPYAFALEEVRARIAGTVEEEKDRG